MKRKRYRIWHNAEYTRWLELDPTGGYYGVRIFGLYAVLDTRFRHLSIGRV